MGMDREFIILISAGILSLVIIGTAGVEHIVTGSIVVALIVGLALMLALARFGPDRVPLESYLWRRWRYARSPRRYAYLQPHPGTSIDSARPRSPANARWKPVSWELQDIGAAYGLATAFVLIGGGYFLLWLGNGGSEELALVWRFLLSR